MDEFEESSPAAKSKPSKTPSWITLGFIVGALFVWALPRPREPAASAPATSEVKPAVPAPPPAHQRLSDVEAYFAEWGRYAVWMDDITYVRAWDSTSKLWDSYEVLRRGNALYFRSETPPRKMRPVPNVPSNSPLEFLNPVPETRPTLGDRFLPVEPVPDSLPRE